ncbi:MAG: hypothetical protein HYY16_06385, partial [Planctomycetes bacterium]|nr:hypothetical protein [Planctomycetota bacterium]
EPSDLSAWSRFDPPLVKMAHAWRQAGDPARGFAFMERCKGLNGDEIRDARAILDAKAALKDLLARFPHVRSREHWEKIHMLLRNEGRWLEAAAWCALPMSTTDEASEARLSVAYGLLDDAAQPTALAPELLEAATEGERARMKEVERELAEWQRQDLPERERIAARTIAAALRTSETRSDTPNDDAVLDLLQRLAARGDREPAFELLDSLSGKSTLAEHRFLNMLHMLAGDDKPLLYRHAILHVNHSHDLHATGLTSEEALRFACGRADAGTAIVQDFLVIALCARGALAERDDLAPYLERGVQTFPDHANLWEALGDDHYASGRFAKTLEAYHRSGQCTETASWGVLLTAVGDKFHPEAPIATKIACAALECGDTAGGVAALDACWAHVRGFYGTEWGGAYARLGQLDKARSLLAPSLTAVAHDQIASNSPYLHAELEACVRLAEALAGSGERVPAFLVAEVTAGACKKLVPRDDLHRRAKQLLERLTVPAEDVIDWLCARGAPLTDEHSRTVVALVARLSSDDPAERDNASSALRRLTPSVAPALKKHAAGAPPEVRGRLTDILLDWAREAVIANP